MSYDDGDQDGGEEKSKKFFGLELSDGVTYIIVVILALIFIRQVSVLF